MALGVLAMTVGLIRGETAGDLRTLAATGASGATRRTLNATSAGALALLGGILGTAAAYLALIAWHWHDISYLNSRRTPTSRCSSSGCPPRPSSAPGCSAARRRAWGNVRSNSCTAQAVVRVRSSS